MRRPGVRRWLQYALTGSLPAEYREWVLHDTTAGTWFIRYVGRVMVVIAVPEVLLIALVPAPGPIRALTAVTVGACVLLLMSIVSSDSVERVAQRAGYSWGTAASLRNERSVAAQYRQAAAYRERKARRRI